MDIAEVKPCGCCGCFRVRTRRQGIETETVVEDQDGDGYLDDDCDDNNASVHPGMEEICDGVDNNCDGQIDEEVLMTFYVDSDGDGL